MNKNILCYTVLTGLLPLGVEGNTLEIKGSNQVKPNIIYILADDMGYAELGCFGQEKIETPNIDQLAAEGMRFTNHYSGQAVSGPSRCSLFTGFHSGMPIFATMTRSLLAEMSGIIER